MRGRYILPLFTAIFITGNLISGRVLWLYQDTRIPALIIAGTAICLVIIQIIISFFAKQKLALYFSIAFLSGSIGICTRHVFAPDKTDLPLKDGQTMPIEAVICDLGQTKKGDKYLKAEVGGEHTYIYNICHDLEYHVGDTVRMTVRVNAVKNFTEDFDYEKHMARKGIYHTCFMKLNSTIEVSPCRKVPLRLKASRHREGFSYAIDTLFPLDSQKEAKAVIKAITFGYRDELSENTKEAFRNTGAMHLLALSGMHLGIIYSILSGILSLFMRSENLKKIRSVILLIILWGYTVFTGCGMSILRATVMVSVYETAALLDRQRNGLCALAFSAFIITAFDPYAPSDTGFQLSCCAMLGIFLIFPFLQKMFPFRNSYLCKFRDTCSIGISCQLFTSPIIYLKFGTFAVQSILTGLLCTPLTSLAIMLTPLSFIDSGAFAFIGKSCATVIELAINCILLINNSLSGI